MDRQCDHKCHKTGLNPWVPTCPVCGCYNEAFDATVPAPRTFEDLLAYAEEREKQAPHD